MLFVGLCVFVHVYDGDSEGGRTAGGSSEFTNAARLVVVVGGSWKDFQALTLAGYF